MPTLEFKGKQHIYAHHLTVPYRPLVADAGKSVRPAGTNVLGDAAGLASGSVGQRRAASGSVGQRRF